jgi:hypothetical protein
LSEGTTGLTCAAIREIALHHIDAPVLLPQCEQESLQVSFAHSCWRRQQRVKVPPSAIHRSNCEPVLLQMANIACCTLRHLDKARHLWVSDGCYDTVQMVQRFLYYLHHAATPPCFPLFWRQTFQQVCANLSSLTMLHGAPSCRSDLTPVYYVASCPTYLPFTAAGSKAGLLCVQLSKHVI